MVILASPKTDGHSPKVRLVVTMIRGALVEPADEVEQQLASGLGEGQVAELVEDDEVARGQLIGEPALAAGAGFGLEPVDQVDDVEEAAPGAIADAGPRDGDGEMALAGAGAADQHGVALVGQESRRPPTRGPAAR